MDIKSRKSNKKKLDIITEKAEERFKRQVGTTPVSRDKVYRNVAGNNIGS